MNLHMQYLSVKFTTVKMRRYEYFLKELRDSSRISRFIPGSDSDTFLVLLMLSMVNQVRESLDKTFLMWEDVSNVYEHCKTLSQFAAECVELTES